MNDSRATTSDFLRFALLLCMAALLTGVVLAQPGASGNSASSTDVLTVSGQFTAPDSQGVSVLYLSARVSPGWHIYSVTQPKGGPIATKIAIDEPKLPQAPGPARAWPKPHVGTEAAFGDLSIETHDGSLVWYLPVRLPAGTNVDELSLKGKVTVQACNERGCLPPKPYQFTATLGQGVQLPKEADPVAPLVKDEPQSPHAAMPTQEGIGELRQPGSHTTISGRLNPETTVPGGRAQLILTARPDPSYHVYALESVDSGQGIYKPTLIRQLETAGLSVGMPTPDRDPETKSVPITEGTPAEVQRYYEEVVSWTIEIAVPADAPYGDYPLAGVIGYQSCYEGGCDRPLGARFDVELKVGPQTGSEAAPLRFTKASYRDARNDGPQQNPETNDVATVTPTIPIDDSSPTATATVPQRFDFQDLVIQGDDELAEMSLAWVVVLGFAGGVVLNLMPCVLPVIGLKLLSFVEQSHHSRARVFALNVWYSLGLMSVFMILATLAAFAGFGWGELFKYTQFNIALAAVVFVMSLSFLGVWEIPIPGFAGSGKAAELAAQEGVAGAFAKGAITTVLATPCTGPFLTTALVWAVAKPPLVVYMVFFSVGFGMAFPYLLIGAFPRLIRWLPKPGAWMDTLKQIMGFVLLATLIYLLTILPPVRLVPTMALLFGLWAACWWIGRHQWSTAEHSKLRSWLQAAVFATAAGVFSFTWLQNYVAGHFERAIESRIAQAMNSEAPVGAGRSPDHIQWKPFSLQAFEQVVNDQKTVMVDFTAPWCLTCQVLEAQVLNTKPVREVLDRNQVITMQAQWVDEHPDTGVMLEKLKSEQIPVVAIFPAGRWNQPIVLRGVYPAQKLIEALEQAGPSHTSAASVATSDVRVPSAR